MHLAVLSELQEKIRKYSCRIRFPFPIDMRFGVVRFLAWFELSLQKSRRGQRD